MSKVHRELGIDPRDYTHISSDAKTTTLKHKRGHTLTIAHSVLKPSTQMMLRALSKIPQENQTEGQKQEAQDQHQYGKVIMKADGGNIAPAPVADKDTQKPPPKPIKNNEVDNAGGWSQAVSNLASPWANGGTVNANDPDKAKAVAQYERGNARASQPASNTRPMAVKPTKESAWGDDAWPLPSETSVGRQQKAHGGEVSAYDAGLPCLNPNCKSHGQPHANCKCYAGHAKGGQVTNLRYCAYGMPHEDGCEYASGGRVESNDHLDSGTKPGRSTQGEEVRRAVQQPTNRGHDAWMRNAKAEAKGRASMERHVNPKMKGLAQGGNVQRYAEGTGAIVPYGMNESDVPKDEHQTEQDMDQYEANNPSRLEQSNNKRIAARSPSPAIQPGMPGYQEPSKPIDDTEDPPIEGTERQPMPQMGHTNPSMIDQGNDHYGHLGSEPQSDNIDNELDQPPNPANMTQPQAAPDHAAEIMNDTKDYQQDLLNGHITPKTYNDLMYHNKDGSEKSTLGKIGSIFGLILSSAGAGLAHQPVMALQMMDNVIKNDLDAQVKSKENAQNFYRLNQQMLLNNANVQNVLASANLTDEQKAAVKQGIDMKAAALSYNQLGSSAVHSMIDKVNTMPEGPEKQKAAQVAMMVAQAAETNGAKAAAIAAAGINGLSMYGVNPENKNATSEEAAEQKFQNDMQARENAGDKAGADSLRERHRPGVAGFATKAIPQHISDKLDQRDILDDKVKDMISYAQENRASMNPKIRTIAAQKAHELTNYYNGATDKLGMTPGRLGWLEKQISTNPTSIIEQILGSQGALKEIQDSNAHLRNIQLQKLGFPVNPGPPGSSATPTAPRESISKSGKPMVFRSGRWEYK